MKRDIGYYWVRISDQRGWEVMLYNEHGEFLRCGIPTPWFEDEVIEVGERITHPKSGYTAAPSQEPVAWRSLNSNGQYSIWQQKPVSDYWIENEHKLEPLYTHPSAAAQIAELETARREMMTKWGHCVGEKDELKKQIAALERKQNIAINALTALRSDKFTDPLADALASQAIMRIHAIDEGRE